MIMRHEIRERWVEALRSGRYKKAMRRLGSRESGVEEQCALGVLCELAVLDGVIVRHEIGIDDYTPVTIFAYGDSTENLPVEVMDWAGLDAVDPHVINQDGNISAITELNDGCGLEFDAIAKLVDADPDRKSDIL